MVYQLKNHSLTGALSCRFSTNSPNLLSTSLYNGVVAIYDIRTSCEKVAAQITFFPPLILWVSLACRR